MEVDIELEAVTPIFMRELTNFDDLSYKQKKERRVS